MRARVLLTLTVAVLLLPDLVMAQASPSTRVRSFFDALAAERWRDAAALIHPERLPSFQHEQVKFFLAFASQLKEIAEKRSRGQSDRSISIIGNEVVIDRALLAEHGDTPLPGFGDGMTVGRAAALEPREFMALFLEASANDEGIDVTRRVIGHVIEREDVAHVLYRLEGASDHDATDMVELVLLRRMDGEWFVWPMALNLDFAGGSTWMPLLEALDDPSEPPVRD